MGSRHRDTWSYGSSPLKVDPRGWAPRRRPPKLNRRRRISGFTVLLTVGYAAVAVYGVDAVRSFTHVDVTVDGLSENAVLTSASLAGRSVTFAVKPSKELPRSKLFLDGTPVSDDAHKTHETSVLWEPGKLPEGRHEVMLSIPRPGMGDARFHRKFVVDDTAPAIDVAPVADPAGVCDPLTIKGRVEPSSAKGPGEPMRLYANLNHMHLIDPATDQVL